MSKLSERLRVVYHGKRLLITYIISYVAVLIIPVTIGLLFYQETITTLEQSLINNQMKAIVATRQRIDQRFDEVEAIALQLSLNSSIIKLQSAISPINRGVNVVSFNIVQNNLLALQAANRFIDSFMVYFRKSNSIITPVTVYLRLPEVYGGLIHFSGLSYDDWQSDVLQRTFNRTILPSRFIHSGDLNSSYLVYAQSMPINATYQNIGNIFIMIDEKQLHQMMDGLQMEDGGWASIYDDQGTLLVNHAPARAGMTPDLDLAALSDQPSGFHEAVVDDKPMMIFWERSPANGWLYVAAVSKNIIMNRVDYIRNLLVIVLIAILSLGLLVAFVQAYRNFVPLRNVIRMLKDQVGGIIQKETPDTISQAVAQLIDRDKDLQMAVERQKPLLRNAMLDNLLRGYSSSEEQLDMTIQLLDMRIGPCVIAVILRINGYGDLNPKSLPHLNVASAVLRESAIQAIGPDDYLIDASVQDIVLILSLDTVNQQDVRSRVMSVVTCIHEQANLSFSAAAGDAAERVFDLHRSYQQSMDAIEFAAPDQDHVIVWYGDQFHDDTGFIYRPDTEQQIINLVKGANRAELERVLDNLHQENLMARSLNSLMQRFWISDLYATLLKVMNQVPCDSHTITAIHELALGLGSKKTKDDFDQIRSLLLAICSMQSDSRINRQQSNINMIRHYLLNNCHEPWLDLNHVASHFSISPTYLSQFYKDQTGLNFSEELENFRMARACTMLAESDQSIEEIARQTGYQSATAFRRAFKRHEGIAPTEFRTSKRINQHGSTTG